MGNILRKTVTVILLIALLVTLVPTARINEKAASANDLTNGIIIPYDYGTASNGARDYGFIFVPYVEGELQAMILMHGGTKLDDPANSTGSGALAQTWMNEFTNKSNIRPRIVIMPMVPNSTKGTNKEVVGNQNFDYKKFLDGVLPGLVKRIEDGTFNTLIENALKDKKSNVMTSIDTSKKMIISGYSMGGAAALYAGSRYPDKFPYVGAFSPSQRFLWFRSKEQYFDGWSLEGGKPTAKFIDGTSKYDKDAKIKIDYATDSDRFLFVSGCDLESAYFGGSRPAEDYYKYYAKDSGFVLCRFLNGLDDGHNKSTQMRECFCFLYQLDNGTIPEDSEVQQFTYRSNAHKTVTCEREYSNLEAYSGSDRSAQDKTEEKTEAKTEEMTTESKNTEVQLSGTITKSIDDNPRVGDVLYVTVGNDCNCSTLQYRWYKDNSTKSFCNNMKCKMRPDEKGCSIVCKVSDSTGKIKGELVAEFGTVYDDSLDNSANDDFTVNVDKAELEVYYNEAYSISVDYRDDLTYQWQYSVTGRDNDWTNSNNQANKATLNVPNATRDIMYRCVVSNGSVSKTSDVVKVSVKPVISSIKSSAANGVVGIGEAYSITVKAEGLALEYKWQFKAEGKDWQDSTAVGYNKDTISLVGKEEHKEISYRCIVKSVNSTTISDVLTFVH